MSDERILAQVGSLARPARVVTPQFVPYVRGAPRPQWAERALAEAEKEHGRPGPAPRPARPCKCSCGGEIPAVTGAGRQADYLDGHRPREAGKPGVRPARKPPALLPAFDDRPRCRSCGYLFARCNCPGRAR